MYYDKQQNKITRKGLNCISDNCKNGEKECNFNHSKKRKVNEVFARCQRDDNSPGEEAWKNVKEKLNALMTELTEEIDYYIKNPSKHPLFEVKKHNYQTKRTKELIRRGKNPKNYCIESEFHAEWEFKLKNIYDEILYKEKLRIIHDCSISKSRSLIDVAKTPSFDVSNNPESSNSSHNHSQDNSEVSHILRKLSVLEDHLAPLGPKLMALFSEALLLEKTNGAYSILSVEENCLLLETIKDKLKGLVEFGMMQHSVLLAIQSVFDNLLTNDSEQYIHTGCDSPVIVFERVVRNKTNSEQKMTDIVELNAHNKPYKATSLSSGHGKSSQAVSDNVKRIYKISDIKKVVQELESLTHLSFDKKTTLAHEIVSVLISRKESDISEDDLLHLIRINCLMNNYNQYESKNLQCKVSESTGHSRSNVKSYSKEASHSPESVSVTYPLKLNPYQ